jgi:2-polyprenyl-6-methoxyphenol hydroxylase-like FAD-dependent oxidoreductase
MPRRIAAVGAGIAGLATGVALQRRGFDVTLIEERTDASSGAGISIWPNALAALDEIGLGDAVRDAGGRVTTGALRWRDGTWLRRPDPDRFVTALGEPLVVVRRAALTEILHGGLSQATLRRGITVTGVVETDDGVRLQLSDGSINHSDAVIGADGTYSMIARHLNGRLAHKYTGYTAWRGVADCSIDPDLAGETVGSGVSSAMCQWAPGTPTGSPQNVLPRRTPTRSNDTTSTTVLGRRCGREARSCLSATPPTRCDHISARAVARV